ncbi:cinnamoyl-CoA reductase 1-like [Dorcoceras hygrometricum]|uniref:Dihydroflavonol 4-reductase n=1 Tax=Dorcoceras hygrometricum TaxID=472368 RepID=A0A2Z7C854_9LAMI|nr:cinnamoyl-CoA reductase 1-like [Dorcoceras hygrometricum]
MELERERMSSGKVVCVTGASGYIASWLVKLLLQRGYTVKATVRNISDPKKVAHLKGLEGAEERLQLFEANLTEDGSFDSVVHGCEGVFHTASPALAAATDPQVELIEPAVKGTLNVLKACSKEPSVRRVVVTSSIVAVMFNRRPQGPDAVVDETWFSDPVFCEEIKAWYCLSKTLAEEAAWKFSQENGIDLVAINPGYVIGPLLQPTLNSTSEEFVHLIKGKKIYPYYVFDDVRDVAQAHVLAFENPSASGRYLLTGAARLPGEVLEIVHNLYPSLDLPKVPAGDPTFQVCNKRAKDLGVVFTPLEVSLKDMIESLKEKNFLV